MTLSGHSLSNATCFVIRLQLITKLGTFHVYRSVIALPSSYRARQMSLLYEDDKREIPRKFQQFSLSMNAINNCLFSPSGSSFALL